MKNLYDPLTEIVHLQGVDFDGSYTLCGLENDSPDKDSFREEEDVMVETTKACTCPDCIEKAEKVLKYLLHEYQRISYVSGDISSSPALAMARQV